MNSASPKPVGLRLDSRAYDSLRKIVLRRDGWQCRSCGTMSNLEVDHKQFRNHSGQGAEENLITL
jgi:5-methylcytosine-specific restriction endonuclease McrA